MSGAGQVLGLLFRWTLAASVHILVGGGVLPQSNRGMSMDFRQVDEAIRYTTNGYHATASENGGFTFGNTPGTRYIQI